MRQALGRPVLLRCSLLRGSPQRIASAVWRFKGQLLPPPPVLPAAAAEGPDHAELRLDALTRDSSGNYECSVSNDVGSATCLFQVSGELRVRPTPICSPTPSWDQAPSSIPTSTPSPPPTALPHLPGLLLPSSFCSLRDLSFQDFCPTLEKPPPQDHAPPLVFRVSPLWVTDCSIPFFGLLQPRPFQMPHSRFGPSASSNSSSVLLSLQPRPQSNFGSSPISAITQVFPPWSLASEDESGENHWVPGL